MGQSNFIIQCPDCKRIINFAGTTTNVKVCDVCGSAVRKKSDGTVFVQPHWLVSEKNDSIRVGVTGEYNALGFVILGRVRTWLNESVFNYWTIQFKDGSECLLAEGYGIYALMSKTDTSITLPTTDRLKVEIKETLSGEEFVVQRVDNCGRWELEGEVKMEGLNDSFRILELVSGSGRLITLFHFPKSTVVVYETNYISFASLHLNGLHTPELISKVITCRNCSSKIEIRAYPYTQSCSCVNCNTGYALDEKKDFIKANRYTLDRDIRIPLGAKGVIKDIAYEVIGFAEKEELNNYHSQWREYTLYNPHEGFATLSEYDGHWIYVRETAHAPVIKSIDTPTLEFEQEPFQLYNGYTYKVKGAAGEFPYNAFFNGGVKVREFISPPEMWIMEKHHKEGYTWYWGEHLKAGVIKSSFEPCLDLPQQFGVGAVQPRGYINGKKLFLAALLGLLLLLVVHGISTSNMQEKNMLSEVYLFNDSTNTVSVVTEKFYLNKSSGNLLFKIGAVVDNSWFELNATLVNATTGEEYSFEKGVEFYSGVSDGESWSEGDRRAETYLTAIPRGHYFLQLLGSRDASGFNKLNEFALDVVYDVPGSRNLGFSILLLLLWPIGKYMVVRSTERKRWSNSPYSHYEK